MKLLTLLFLFSQRGSTVSEDSVIKRLLSGGWLVPGQASYISKLSWGTEYLWLSTDHSGRPGCTKKSQVILHILKILPVISRLASRTDCWTLWYFIFVNQPVGHCNLRATMLVTPLKYLYFYLYLQSLKYHQYLISSSWSHYIWIFSLFFLLTSIPSFVCCRGLRYLDISSLPRISSPGLVVILLEEMLPQCHIVATGYDLSMFQDTVEDEKEIKEQGKTDNRCGTLTEASTVW